MIFAKKKYHPFALLLLHTQNVVIFSVKVIFREREREREREERERERGREIERELFVPVDLSKSSIENLLRETFGGHQRKIFVPHCSIQIRRKFYAILEFYREEEAFCLRRIACFGPLDNSRLFGQL